MKAIITESGVIIPLHAITSISPKDCTHYIFTNNDDGTGYKLSDEEYKKLLDNIELI